MARKHEQRSDIEVSKKMKNKKWKIEVGKTNKSENMLEHLNSLGLKEEDIKFRKVVKWSVGIKSKKLPKTVRLYETST